MSEGRVSDQSRSGVLGVPFIRMSERGTVEWQSFLVANLGWHARECGEWTCVEGAGGALWFGPEHRQALPDVGIYVAEGTFARLCTEVGVASMTTIDFMPVPGLLLTDPHGIRLFVTTPSTNLHDGPHAAVFANHLALNVPDIDAGIAWYGATLDTRLVLLRHAPTDPRSSDVSVDAHLYEPERYYLTLRCRATARSPRDHIGFMADSHRTVDRLHAAVCDLGWPVLVDPTVIDGSYLFHFACPDGSVSDVFFPTSNLMGRP